MADPAHLAKLNEGSKAWNVWREQNPSIDPDLSEIDLGAIDVEDVKLERANLRKANLRNLTGLLPAQLAGANLIGAELPPDVSELPALDFVAEVSRHARVNFLAVVASCVFCWLTLAKTTDGALSVNVGVTTLPVLNTDVPVIGFYLAAPAILLVLYVYL